MISKFIFLIQKSFVYLISMFGALVFAYFLGLNPLLKAQTTVTNAQQPQQAITNADSLNVNTSATNRYSEEDLKKTESELLNKAQISTNTANDSASGSAFMNNKNNEYQYSRSYIGDVNSMDKDPFRKPEYLLRLEEDEFRPKTPVDTFVRDDKMEAIRRWQIGDYKLIGVIWDVKNPKAMIVDPSGTKHLIRRNHRMGNKNGLVSEIGEGSITVLQDGVPIVIDMSGD